MQAKLRQAFSVISTAVVLIFSLIAYFTISDGVAWFANNKSVHADKMAITVESGVKIEATLISYGVLDINGLSYDADLSAEKYDLPLHDPNGILFSEYQLALLIKIELRAAETVDAEIYAETENGEIPLEKDTVKNNHVSNCVIFTPAAFDEANGIATKSESGTKGFTSVDATGSCKKDKSLLLFSGELTSEPTMLYFIMEYNEPFLEYLDPIVMTHWLEDPYVNYENDITFSVYGY